MIFLIAAGEAVFLLFNAGACADACLGAPAIPLFAILAWFAGEPGKKLPAWFRDDADARCSI